MKPPIRKRGRRKKIQPLDIDITSLLDILVIMLVFLLKSYNSSGVTFNIPKDIKLPQSNSRSLNTMGVNIQISPTTIWVDNKVVLDTKSYTPRAYDHGGKRILPLYDELVAKRKTIQEVEKATPQAKKFSGIVNLLVDKSLKYSYLKKVLYTVAEAGYSKYKFVVLGEEQ
jgi:biopolymer transport protein ExbD